MRIRPSYQSRDVDQADAVSLIFDLGINFRKGAGQHSPVPATSKYERRETAQYWENFHEQFERQGRAAKPSTAAPEAETEQRIRDALATPGRPEFQKIAAQFGVATGTVQRIANG
jgi:hypothetical protein